MNKFSLSFFHSHLYAFSFCFINVLLCVEIIRWTRADNKWFSYRPSQVFFQFYYGMNIQKEIKKLNGNWAAHDMIDWESPPIFCFRCYEKSYSVSLLNISVFELRGNWRNKLSRTFLTRRFACLIEWKSSQSESLALNRPSYCYKGLLFVGR